jgi:hypothetical protein
MQMIIILIIFNYFHNITAGKATTNEELEEMLEQGNSAVFTQGVKIIKGINKNVILSKLF